MKRHIGVDLHRNQLTACVRTNGRNHLSTYSLKQLPLFCRRLRPNDEVAVEMTGNTRLFAEAVTPHVGRVVFVNPQQFKVVSASVSKTDANDARRLALFLEKDLLPEVRMKDKQHAEMKSLAQTRDKLVKLRTALKNKINNLLSSYGILLKKESLSSTKGLNAVLGMPLGDVPDVEVRVLVEQIHALNKSIAELEKTMEERGPKLPGHKNLKSIKGIGDVSAGILLSVIGDVNDFADAGKLASYFGIVPRVSNSNETQRSGRITKRGSKLGRTTLVQCALTAMNYNARLRSYFERIKERRGGGKAIIALARKFLNIIYMTLKDDLVWEDFANGVVADAKGCAATTLTNTITCK